MNYNIDNGTTFVQTAMGAIVGTETAIWRRHGRFGGIREKR